MIVCDFDRFLISTLDNGWELFRELSIRSIIFIRGHNRFFTCQKHFWEDAFVWKKKELWFLFYLIMWYSIQKFLFFCVSLSSHLFLSILWKCSFIKQPCDSFVIVILSFPPFGPKIVIHVLVFLLLIWRPLCRAYEFIF